MKKNKYILLLVICVFGYLGVAQKTLFVDSGQGNNSNPGTSQNQAYKTIQYATGQAEPGDLIKVLPGTYTGENPDSPWSEIFISGSGNPNNYITIQGVKDNNGNLPKVVSASVKGMDLINVSYLIIENLEFVASEEDTKGMINNPSFGIELWRARRAIGIDNQSHHIIFRNNYIHDFPGNGIAIGGSEVILIEGNLVEHCAFQSRNGNSGISSYQPANIDVEGFPEYPNHRIIFKDNISRYNVNLRGFAGSIGVDRITDGNGIIVDDHIQDQKENGTPYKSRTLVVGNICYGNGGQGVNVFSSDNVDVYNNTLFDNAQSTRIENPAYQVVVGDSQLSLGRVKNAKVKNNILFNSNNSKTTISRYEDVNIEYDQNIHWNASGNPEPVNPNVDLVIDPKLINAQGLNASQTNVLATATNPFNPNSSSAKLRTPTKNNNFPVQDLRLESGSPAIDAGINVGFGTVIGASIDIGAIEFDPNDSSVEEDKIISTQVPAQVTPGSNVKLTVNYSSKGSRDIIIYFQLDDAPFTVYGSKRVDVTKGTRSIEIEVPIAQNTPIKNDAYQFQTIIAPDGGNYSNRFDNLNKLNIDCIHTGNSLSTLEIGAKGNCANEKIELRINDKTVAQYTLTNNIEIYRYENYEEGQNIKVAFINDDNNNCDRNVYLDWIKVCDQLLQTEDQATRTGCGSSEWLYCNGYFDFGSKNCNNTKDFKEDVFTNVYPNPVKDKFFISTSGIIEYVEIIDVNGKRIYESTHNNTNMEIDVDKFSKGVYLVKIKEKNHTSVEVKRIVIQ